MALEHPAVRMLPCTFGSTLETAETVEIGAKENKTGTRLSLRYRLRKTELSERLAAEKNW